MERQEIVKMFLKNGFQLSENTLPIIEKKPEEFLTQIRKIKPRPFIVTKKHLEKVNETTTRDKCPKIKLIKKYSFEKKELRADDYTKHFGEIYEKIKDILLKNTRLTKLVSVNKITYKTSEFSLIVLVREKGMNSLLTEDPTGETHVFFIEDMKKEFDDVGIDNIIGLICKKKEDKIYAKKVIYPGIPITRKINKTEKEIKLFYLYKPSLLDEKDQEKLIGILRQTKKTYPIFVYGKWEDKEVVKEFNNIFLFSEKNYLLEIEEVKILVLTGPNDSENVLNRRLVKGDGLLNIFPVEEIPDIILTSEERFYSKNYKGTTIVSNNDKNKYFVLNLKTREVEEKRI